MSDRKTGYSPLNAENNWGVTNDVCAYAHKKNILLSVFSIFFFPFYDFNLNTQGFVYSEFVKYQLGLHRNVQVFTKCNLYRECLNKPAGEQTTQESCLINYLL